jgi:hypothetical protein
VEARKMNKKILGVFLILLAAAIIMLPKAMADRNSSENETRINESEHQNETHVNETGHDEKNLNETQHEIDDDLNETKHDDEEELNETEHDDSEDLNETQHEIDDDLNETNHDNEEDINETEDDDDCINETEEKEIHTMRTQHGAEVRLLELEKAITRNILVGNQTIAAITAGNSSANTSALSEILDKLIVLRTEVQGLELNRTPEELAQQFVDIKREAINLSNQFRDGARPLLKETDREILKEYMKNLEMSWLKEINDDIDDARHRYNFEFINATFARLGLNNTALLERIRNGYADEDEIKSYLKTALKNETSHERNEIMQKLREAEAKGNVYSEAVRQKISENQIERLNNRSEKMEEELHKIKETQEHLEDRIDEISDEITEHKNRNGRDD